MYWIKEFVGDAIMLLGVAWSSVMFGGIAIAGSITFIEQNPWILWIEVVMVILSGIVVSDRIVDDVLRFSKGKR
jgi:cytochrome c biogenesis protein CcdA